jgi:hypothetical protein
MTGIRLQLKALVSTLVWPHVMMILIVILCAVHPSE